MTDSPSISIVIPAYNHASYIGAAIESILNQDYPELEIIVIDDGSIDQTAEEAKKALELGNWSYRLISQENAGAHAALNRGIQLAKGDYIAILNSDDRYLPGRLSRMMDALVNSNRRFAFSKVSHIDTSGSPHPYQVDYLNQIEEAARFPTISFELLRNNIAATTGNFIFHRSLYDEVGGFNPYVTCHDWDFILRVILIEEPLFVDEILMEYRIHSRGTLQLNLDIVDKEVEQIMINYLKKVEEAKNPLAPGPLQWGEYWNIFSDTSLERIRAFPAVEAQLEAMKAQNLLLEGKEVYSRLDKPMTSQRLQHAEEQLGDGNICEQRMHPIAPYMQKSKNGIKWRASDTIQSNFDMQNHFPEIPAEIFEPIGPVVNLDLTQVSLQIPSPHKAVKTQPRLLLILPWMVMGGAERFGLNLIDQLASRGWQISIVCTAPSNNAWKEGFARRTADIVVLPEVLPIQAYPRYLRYFIEIRDFDAVLLQGSIEGYRLLPTLHGLFPGLPILDYLHFVTPDWMDGGFPRLSYLYRDGIDLTITSCQQVKQWMVAEGAEEERLRVCPIGVDPEYWKPDAAARLRVRQKMGIRDDEAVLVYAARLEAQKQPLVYAETLRILMEQGVPFRGLIAGEGALRAELEQKIKNHGLGDKVTLLGRVSSEEMAALLAAGDIFFLPSENEGISSAIYEAMACGLPVVGVDVGGQAELVTPECGILVPPLPPEQQPEAYSKVLQGLIEDVERRKRMGAASRERILCGFTLDHMGNCMSGILAEAIQGKREGTITPPVLSPDERFLRETQHVVEYLQARQEWRSLENVARTYQEAFADVDRKYSELIQPKPASYWFYLWLRQLFLPVFETQKDGPFGHIISGIQKWLKRTLLKQ